jgi:hypothetical protein
VRWPASVQLLLKYGANINVVDSQGLSLIHYAISQDCVKTVKLLLEADCSLYRDKSDSSPCLLELLHDACPDIQESCISALAERRWRLWNLCLQNCHDNDLRPLQTDGVPDAIVGRLLSILKYSGISISPALRVITMPVIVFHWRLYTAEFIR